MSRRKEVVIIGGGASGMLSAILLARQAKKVLLIEKNKSLGKKLSATGNGRCNFTNEVMDTNCYYGGSTEEIKTVLDRFGWKDTVSLFRDFGILERSREGYIYPKTNQASTVVEKLKQHCQTYGVEILLEEMAEEIRKIPEGFYIQTDRQAIVSDYVILACGGMACAELGGSPLGYRLAKQLGHTVTPLYPGLTGFISKGKWLSEFAGVRFFGKLSVYDENMQCIGMDSGEIQCTKTGISGIPAFQLCHPVSALWEQTKQTGGQITGMIDFYPEMTEEELVCFIKKQEKQFHLSDILSGMLHKKCVKEVLRRGNTPEKAASVLKAFSFPITGTAGFEKAQVTAGGVPLQEINMQTMSSKKVEGLYLTGELLDADGICGGYNLQWAWSTAYLSAEDIIKRGK